MKNLFKTFIAVAIVAVTVQSCKKGEDDGALSLSSRKARFAGEWMVDSWDQSTTEITTNNGSTATTTDTDVNSEKIAGSSYTSTTNSTSTAAGSTASLSSSTGTVSAYTYTIEKDGTWSSKMVTKITSSTNTFGGITITDAEDNTTTIEANGTWQFLGKNKSAELKNKEAVLLSTAKETTTILSNSTSGGGSFSATSTNTYGLNEATSVWALTKLAKKEMAASATIDNTYTGSSTSTSGSTSSTTKNGPDSSKGTVMITFKQ